MARARLDERRSGRDHRLSESKTSDDAERVRAVEAANEHHRAADNRRRMAGARDAQRRVEQTECADRGIEDFQRRGRRAGIIAARDEHASVRQQRRRVTGARERQRTRRQPRVRRRVVDLRRAERVSVGTDAAGDEHAAIEQQRRRVIRTRLLHRRRREEAAGRGAVALDRSASRRRRRVRPRRAAVRRATAWPTRPRAPPSSRRSRATCSTAPVAPTRAARRGHRTWPALRRLRRKSACVSFDHPFAEADTPVTETHDGRSRLPTWRESRLEVEEANALPRLCRSRVRNETVKSGRIARAGQMRAAIATRESLRSRKLCALKYRLSVFVKECREEETPREVNLLGERYVCVQSEPIVAKLRTPGDFQTHL